MAKRNRKAGLEPSRRNYITSVAPAPVQEEPDTNVPMIGQRKRIRPRRAKLLPTPLKA